MKLIRIVQSLQKQLVKRTLELQQLEMSFQ